MWKVKFTCSKGRCGHSQEVADQPLVLAIGLRARAIGDTGTLNDALITAQVVDQTDKAMVEDRKLLIQNRFCRVYNAVCHINLS